MPTATMSDFDKIQHLQQICDDLLEQNRVLIAEARENRKRNDVTAEAIELWYAKGRLRMDAICERLRVRS